MLSLMSVFPCKLQQAGGLYGIMLKIYCKRCWLILKDIEIILLKKIACGYAVVFSVMILVLLYICNFDLALLIVQHVQYSRSRGGQTCSIYEPHVVKPKLQRAAR